MDPQVTLATLLSDIESQTQSTDKAEQGRMHECALEAAENLHNWLSHGGYAPSVTLSEMAVLEDYADCDKHGNEAARVRVQGILALLMDYRDRVNS